MRAFLCSIMSVSILPVSGTPALSETIKVFAAGSLSDTLKEIIARANVPDTEIIPTFGPAGGLRERIEKGETADLFLSADSASPWKLASEGKSLLKPIPFARNSMCLYGSKDLGLTRENALEKMLDKDLKLATSTPTVDPGGDYAIEVFKRAEVLRTGAGKTLEDKAMHLLGMPGAVQAAAGHTVAVTIFIDKHVDLLLVYCSMSSSLMRQVPDLA